MRTPIIFHYKFYEDFVVAAGTENSRTSSGGFHVDSSLGLWALVSLLLSSDGMNLNKLSLRED